MYQPQTNQPLVSVITPVYNGEKHLAECVESVLAQTYQHWKYVIVDNCSSDLLMGDRTSVRAARARILASAGMSVLSASIPESSCRV